ncbi:MAG: FG-GAP-like repeat-containing protein, partial [Bacteroidales bacterium]|nr:FG-GAP-like repeat-containing protein [Bacteroidales bacterium]
MKKTKILFQIILCVLFIPLFMEAQDTKVEYCRSEFDGNTDFELLDFETAIYENSRTEPVQMPGWPVSIGGGVGICLGDIYGDGLLAIIIGTSNGEFHVFDYFGYDLPGWPKTGLGQIKSKAAVADMDPDYPGLEIIFVTTAGTLHVWHNDGTAVAGWPQSLGSFAKYRSPVISDIDNDGNLEIIVGKGEVNVFNHDGTMYPGWPQFTDDVCSGTVSVADVDNDGIVEICAVSYKSVYLWDKDGNIEPGWPLLNVAVDMCYAQPILADLDDDGDLEILHSYVGSGSSIYIGIYHHDGTNFDNWPQTFSGIQTFLTPVVGDIDNDGDLEIFGGGHSFELMARHHTGELVDGWPVNIGQILECSPIVFDIDDGGSREVIIGDNTTSPGGRLNAFHGDGSMVVDWPILIPSATMVNSPAVGDVDSDGDIEIALITTDGSVSLLTLEGIPYRNYLTEWGTWFHDNWNTGWFHPLSPQNLTAYFSENLVNLNWNVNTEPDIAGYNIYRSDTSGGPYIKINSTLITETFYNDISGTENHYYCVTAKIYGGTESRLSTEVICQTGWIEGTVSLTGGTGNIEDVVVTAGSISANPDATGLYSIGIYPGTYNVTASLDGYEAETVTDVLVEEGQTTDGIDFTLYPSVGLEDNHLSSKTTLTGNYPNPFNTETT